MRGRIWSSRWHIAATVLAVAQCASVDSIETVLPTAAQAQSSGDQHFRHSRGQSDNFFQDLFGSRNWKRKQQKPHSDSSHAAPQRKTKSKPERSEPTPSERPAAHSGGTTTATVESVPLPRPRPPSGPEPQSFAEAAGPDFDTANVTSALSDCDRRLAAIAAIELLPRLIGPGDCGGRDIIELDAVLLPNRKRVEVKPAAILRCAMAESFAAWVRDEASDHIPGLRSVDTYGSYECRGRNGVADAKLSEHGKGNAIDVRALILAGGRRIDLTDETVSKPVRDDLRESACHRFTTVLGPGADSSHNNHIHLDILERNRGARICQWDVREPPPQPAKVAGARVRLAATSMLAQPRPPENQMVAVGPWAIAPTYDANKLESCRMSRLDGELGITFVRAQDGLLVILESQKWKLDRGKAYPVHLTAGSRSVDAKALADTKRVSIALTDSKLNSRLRSASNLQVHAEGATLRVPLDRSATGFERLEECFDKREATNTNPLVKRNASERNPFVAPSRKP
jgi:hypothetical protein